METSIVAEDGKTICKLSIDDEVDEDTQEKLEEAMGNNARLIHASPNLLEACEAALEWIKNTVIEEHGDPKVGRVWGLLENSIEKIK